MIAPRKPAAPPSRAPTRATKRAPAREQDGERLAKRVAALMACSRSDAERYVEGAWVRVDGQLVEEPQFRVTNQSVTIDEGASLLELAPVTLLLHKPVGYEYGLPASAAPRNMQFAAQLLGPATHAPNDAAGTRVLKRHFAKLSAGVPLETAASGLVVFTQDWRVARKLAEDASTIEQELMVEVAGPVTPQALQALHNRRDRGGHNLPALKASVSSRSDLSTTLRFAVKGAHPGLLAFVCERAGLRITAMKRLRIGRVPMAQLASGQWRYLQAFERF